MDLKKRVLRLLIAHDGMTQQQIAELLEVETTAVARALSELHDCVDLRLDDGDRRQRIPVLRIFSAWREFCSAFDALRESMGAVTA